MIANLNPVGFIQYPRHFSLLIASMSSGVSDAIALVVYRNEAARRCGHSNAEDFKVWLQSLHEDDDVMESTFLKAIPNIKFLLKKKKSSDAIDAEVIWKQRIDDVKAQMVEDGFRHVVDDLMAAAAHLAFLEGIIESITFESIVNIPLLAVAAVLPLPSVSSIHRLLKYLFVRASIRTFVLSIIFSLSS